MEREKPWLTANINRTFTFQRETSFNSPVCVKVLPYSLQQIMRRCRYTLRGINIETAPQTIEVCERHSGQGSGETMQSAPTTPVNTFDGGHGPQPTINTKGACYNTLEQCRKYCATPLHPCPNGIADFEWLLAQGVLRIAYRDLTGGCLICHAGYAGFVENGAFVSCMYISYELQGIDVYIWNYLEVQNRIILCWIFDVT